MDLLYQKKCFVQYLVDAVYCYRPNIIVVESRKKEKVKGEMINVVYIYAALL